MSGNYFCHVCGGLVDLIKLQPSGVRFCECEKRFTQLRAENSALKAELADADESLKAVYLALEDVDYRGSYADGVKYLKRQLAAVAKERDEIAAQARMLDRMVDERDDQLVAAESKIDTLTKELEIQSYWGPRWEETHTALMAALAACEAKDTALAYHQEQTRPIQRTIDALAIKPDSSALKQHDDALIERCAETADKCYAEGFVLDAIRELKEGSTVSDELKGV